MQILSSMSSSYPGSVICTWRGLDPQLRSAGVKILRRQSARAAFPRADTYSTSCYKAAELCVFPLSLFCSGSFPGDFNLPEYLLMVPGLSSLTSPQKCVCVLLLNFKYKVCIFVLLFSLSYRNTAPYYNHQRKNKVLTQQY